MMSSYIKKLIREGEHQCLDFKFEISDAKKIARSVVAFANTKGGTLLIGVKDNGTIGGIRSEEEYYMVESAAELFSKPAVEFQTKEWFIEGRYVLEVYIPKSKQMPHYAKNKEGLWRAYIRVNDQNFLANDVLLKVWKRKKQTSGVRFKFSKNERLLLDFLTENQIITLTKFCKLAKINRRDAKNILANLISIKVIDIVFTDDTVYYQLTTEYQKSE